MKRIMTGDGLFDMNQIQTKYYIFWMNIKVCILQNIPLLNNDGEILYKI